MEDRFHAIPGVVKVGISSYTPMEDNNWGNGVQVLGQPYKNEIASVVRVNGDYFDSVGTRVVVRPRNHGEGYFDCSIRSGGEPGVCEEVLQPG